jgi:hypothetical protein
MASIADDSVVVREKGNTDMDAAHVEDLEKIDTFDIEIDIENKLALK